VVLKKRLLRQQKNKLKTNMVYTPMEIDSFGGKIVTAKPLPIKDGYFIVFDEVLLTWKYASTQLEEEPIHQHYLRNKIS